jgi:hypothetical protein
LGCEFGEVQERDCANNAAEFQAVIEGDAVKIDSIIANDLVAAARLR